MWCAWPGILPPRDGGSARTAGTSSSGRTAKTTLRASPGSSPATAALIRIRPSGSGGSTSMQPGPTVPPLTAAPVAAAVDPGRLTGGGPGADRLLDVGDGLDRGRLRQRLGLVVGADALDVVTAPVGEPLGGLHPALGDQDAQVGAVEPVLAGTVDPHEEGLVLGGDVMPVVAAVLEGQRAVVGQAPRAGPRGGQDPLDLVPGLLHDQLRPDVHGG